VSAPAGAAVPALRIEVLTLFPEAVETYLDTSILGRARRRGVVEVVVHDLRIAAPPPHRGVDDAPFGGGPGMVLAPEPVFAAVEQLRPPRPLFLLGPAGRRFDQGFAVELSSRRSFSLLCGRYEGVDERIAEHLVDGEISIGDYVLAGGELAALVVAEAVIRLVPGSLGNAGSAASESFADGLLEHAQYTRPAVFRGWEVPEVLRSGDHARVARWRHADALARTSARRPDLLQRRGVTPDEVRLLAEHGYPGSAATASALPPGDARAVSEERDPS
jgi:tRNA (guanine37-N1)-methyltransferase